MTRKHFIIMAAEVAALTDREQAKRLAEQLASICKAQNKRFDRARFMTACGV
jgi:hypothetical protein